MILRSNASVNRVKLLKFSTLPEREPLHYVNFNPAVCFINFPILQSMEGGDPLSGLGSNKRCMSLNNLAQNTNVSAAFLLLLSSIIMILVELSFLGSLAA